MESSSPPTRPTRAETFARILIVAILALSLIPISAIATPSKAYGDEIPNVGDTYHGTCYIEDAWMIGTQSYFNVSSFSGELSGSWATGTYECADHTAAEPTYVTADYTATVTAVSVAEGWVEYSVYITPPGVTDGVSRDEQGRLYGYQHVAGTARVAKEFGGYIELHKTSSNPDITAGNANYSLAGAVYNVYNSNNAHVATMTTDNSGFAKTTARLAFGWYNVVEQTAPPGYALDSSDHWVQLTANNDATVSVSASDKPQGDPAMVMVGKIDADTTAGLPQGDTSLGGAEFTIRYFDGYYNTDAEAMASGAPTRTWVLKTDDAGQARLRESYLASGSDALYHNSYGDATIPLGTVVIKETKAPANYLLPAPVPVSVQKITSNTQLENVTTYNMPKIADTVKRGDLSLTKAYDPTPDEDTGEMTPEANIIFDVYASHQFTGSTPNEGASPAFSLTTDESGHADTHNRYFIENADGTYQERPRKATDAGALPHDTYLMVQREAPEGFEKLDPIVVYVSDNGKTYEYLLQNGTIRTPIKVVKTDSETGLAVPFPASWQIIDVATGLPVSMTTHYPTTETFDVFTSDSLGRLTLPEKLPWGDYELKEVRAPQDSGTGYLINPVNIKFTTSDGHDWDNPLEIVFADAPGKGRIELTKTDGQTGEAVKAATYTVNAVGDIYTLDGTLRAHDGEVVDTITTDEFGCAASIDLYLGRYDVIEAVSPDGFALDTARYGVTLEYADQTVAVVTEKLDLADLPTTLEIAKTDSLTGKPMAHVSFLIKADTGGFEQTVTTGEDGIASISYLGHGTYTVSEVETPLGYVRTDDAYTFTVDGQGLIEGKALYTLAIGNAPIQVRLSKTDIATSGELPGCGMEIYAADADGQSTGDALYTWESTGVPHVIAGKLAPGAYVLREAYPALGYTTAKDVAFTVENNGEIQTVVMENDFTKLDVTKRDIATTEELPGAHLLIFGKDETGAYGKMPLYEWISTDEPHRIERIAVGDYLLREAFAPEGFEIAQDIEFSITETGEVQTVRMDDARTPAAPSESYDKTGVDSTPIVIVAILLASGALVGLGIGVKRRLKAPARDEQAPEGESENNKE